jgi:uncharacterized repeat protein (TIGR03837 family)
MQDENHIETTGHPDITILCKVVDNYGDIGFVYRLARSLTLHAPQSRIRLIVSNLSSFSKMAPGIDPNLPVQIYRGWIVYYWYADAICMKEFSKQQPDILLECFQCGRPDWMETLLFSQGVPRIVTCINIDYLTAETYAEDFHRLKSATRSTRVRKINFMPGFTSATGGLIIEKNVPETIIHKKEHTFEIALFSYEQNFAPVIDAIVQFQQEKRIKDSNFHVHVFVAEGKSAGPFIAAWETAGKPFQITKLPFLSQTNWDKLLNTMSFNFIRGEDSLSRASLSGIPFIWHAYPQNENYQLVKVNALLDRIKPFLDDNEFELLFRVWNSYNNPDKRIAESKIFQNDLCTLLHHTTALQPSFTRFSEMLVHNGNFTDHLLTFITRDIHDFC